MDRRWFIRNGLFAAGAFPAAALAQAADKPAAFPMKYRPLGKTGLAASEASFGTYGWQNPGILEAAVERGINLVCTCTDYQSGAAERAIAPAVKKHRDKLIISTGCNCNREVDAATLMKNLEGSLRNIGTDHVDMFLAHMCDEPEQAANPAIPEAFERMKKEGKAAHLAVSTHSGSLEAVLRKAIDLGYYEVIQCKYNFMENSSQDKLFAEARAKGLGIVVFKTKAGSRESEVQALAGKGLEYNQAVVRWALTNENISSVCCAVRSFDDVNNYSDAVGKELSLQDSELLDIYRAAVENSYCRYCGTCAAQCPNGVDVASVMRYQMYFRYYGFEKEAMARYAALDASARPLACAGCDAPCQGACPHGLATRENLLAAHEMLTA